MCIGKTSGGFRNNNKKTTHIHTITFVRFIRTVQVRFDCNLAISCILEVRFALLLSTLDWFSETFNALCEVYRRWRLNNFQWNSFRMEILLILSNIWYCLKIARERSDVVSTRKVSSHLIWVYIENLFLFCLLFLGAFLNVYARCRIFPCFPMEISLHCLIFNYETMHFIALISGQRENFHIFGEWLKTERLSCSTTTTTSTTSTTTTNHQPPQKQQQSPDWLLSLRFNSITATDRQSSSVQWKAWNKRNCQKRFGWGMDVVVYALKMRRSATIYPNSNIVCCTFDEEMDNDLHFLLADLSARTSPSLPILTFHPRASWDVGKPSYTSLINFIVK